MEQTGYLLHNTPSDTSICADYLVALEYCVHAAEALAAERQAALDLIHTRCIRAAFDQKVARLFLIYCQ